MDKAPRDPLIRSFERHLHAENRSERTIATYLIGLRQADTFLRTHGTTLAAATRADLEAFVADVLTRRSASTAATYYKPLKLLYAWLVEEEEIPADPMRRMKRPMVPDKPVPIVPADGLKRLLRACAGNTFEARRDTALLMLLDTGAGRDEMAGLKLSDVDLERAAGQRLGRAPPTLSPSQLAVAMRPAGSGWRALASLRRVRCSVVLGPDDGEEIRVGAVAAGDDPVAGAERVEEIDAVATREVVQGRRLPHDTTTRRTQASVDQSVELDPTTARSGSPVFR